MKTNEEQKIWGVFDKSINEEFLDIRLQRFETELSDSLVLFYQQAIAPQAQVLNLLATHRLFNQSASRFETYSSKNGATVRIYSVSEWFDLFIGINQMGIKVTLEVSKKTVWKKAVPFNSRRLGDNTDYDKLLNNLIADGIEACNTLDTCIEEVNKNI